MPEHHRPLREFERIRKLVTGHPDGVNRSVAQVESDVLTRGQRLADWITTTLGSWKFIITQTVFLAIWLVINSLGWLFNWDPYPFILLNLVLSFQAAFTAPIIMMSQNRQESRDRIASELDYEINRRAASEIDEIQEKLDTLTSRQWEALLEMLAEHRLILSVLDERTLGIEDRIRGLPDPERPA